MDECINLRERFGTRWKVDHEETYWASHTQKSATADPWLMLIPCRHGHICPWGGDLLASCTNKRGPTAGKIMELPFTRVVQDGSDGINATFPVDRFDEVAKVMGAKRKRPPRTESQRRATERLRKYHFKPGKRDANSTLESPPGLEVVSEHVQRAGRTF